MMNYLLRTMQNSRNEVFFVVETVNVKIVKCSIHNATSELF